MATNNIIFTIARMNPPTSGHMMLVKTMITKALDLIRRGNNAIVGIILSHTVDGKKNPLSCEEKRDILTMRGMIDGAKDQMKETLTSEDKDMVDNVRVIILCKDDPEVQSKSGNFPMPHISVLLSQYDSKETPLHMCLVVGEDRVESYNWICSSLNKKTPPIPIEIEALPRPEGAMSATFMRELVKDGKLNEFVNNMRDTGIDDETIERIYNMLVSKMDIDAISPPTKKYKTKGGKRRKSKRKTTAKRRGRVTRRLFYKRG
ncbi:MAG: hypothetical protein EBY22_03445 [Gammaproteobacteria bacterium]|nr:hypothetical protein [Gammaproteobacteria bacterium]